jgi:predicted GIY-YIG superfamily endonuclease
MYECGSQGLHACYLLRPENKHKFPTASYIGYTTHPPRRLRQHNGNIANGAHKTQSKRPWEMLLFVSGFKHRQSALQFEWAWQHPTRSTKIHVDRYTKGILGQLRVLKLLLHANHWRLEDLCITFTNETNRAMAIKAWDGDEPVHVRIAVYSLEQVADKIKHAADDDFAPRCAICLNSNPSGGMEVIECPGCADSVHVLCLAQVAAAQDKLIPLKAKCSGCAEEFTWKEWIDQV